MIAQNLVFNIIYEIKWQIYWIQSTQIRSRNSSSTHNYI